MGVGRQLLSVADRFTVDEHFAPGFQARPMRYFFNEMPADFTLEDFIGSWN